MDSVLAAKVQRLKELLPQITPGEWFRREPPPGREDLGSFVQARTATFGRTIVGPTAIQILADDDYPTKEADVEFVSLLDGPTVAALLSWLRP